MSRLLDLTPKIFIRVQSGRNQRRLYIQCQQRENGQKFLKIFKYRSPVSVCLPNIRVPQDAYEFVAAMDEVIRQLPMREPPHPAKNDESPLVLATQMVPGGRRYDFELSAAWHQKHGEWRFYMQCVPTSEEHTMCFPLWALLELRQQMVKMLEEHDGSEQIDEMPTMPKWATRGLSKSVQKPQQRPRQQQKEDEVQTEKLAKSFVSLGPDRKLNIKCVRGRTGQRQTTIEISMPIIKESTTIPVYLPKILVPQEAYKFVAAMDEVIDELPVEEPTHPDDESPLIMATQIVAGARHYNGRHDDFELSAYHEKGDHWHFEIRSVQTSEEHQVTEQSLYLPFSALPQLHKKMVKMLAEHDGSEWIDEMPTIPKWAWTWETRVIDQIHNRADWQMAGSIGNASKLDHRHHHES